MSFPPFMQAGLDKVLHASVNIDAIVNNAGSLSKLGGMLHKHFCTPAQHLLPAYRSSYQDTLKALRFALNPPYVPLHSKIIKDFQQDVKTAFLPTFPHTQLYKALAKECLNLEKQLLFSQASLQIGTKQAFEADLAALVGSKTLPNLTELILEDVQNRVEISAELLELLRLEDLLGCGIWHFLRADKQLSLLIAALQQEESFQRVIRIDENVVEMLDLVRDIHRFAEKAGNNYADSESANALAEAKRKLDTQQEKSCFTGLTQAFKNPDRKEARKLILQALKLAKTNAEKALVHYSLFKLTVGERAPDLQQAFEHLQQAIQLDKANYAPCETDTFEIQALLGVGGMGYALLARSGAVELVVKCFWQELENKQFAEAVKMQTLQSQYVPELFGNGIHRYRERLCLVTHYLPQAVDGARWLAQHGKLDENVGLVVAIRLAEALQAIHQAGVLHLDLKPANVLLLPAAQAENWEVRVIDFGLSKLLPQFKNHGRTQTMTGTASHTVTLSLDYASPEQKAGEKLMAASDVFSYGKTLFDLVGDMNSLETPEKLEIILKRCVRSRPEERITLNVLLTELTSLHGGKIPENPTDSSAAQAELERLRREQAKREKQAAAKLAKEREELTRQQREHEEKLQQDQARLEKEKAELERKKREHEEQTRLAKEREELARQQREHEEWLKKEQERLVQEAAELERKKKGNDKGFARTFATMQAGRTESFTVYEKTFDVKGVTFEMVYILAGEFMMGSNKDDREKPVHKVKITKPFYMGKYQVTQKQWEAVMESNPSYFKGDDLPVMNVNWEDCQAFCKKLSALTGKVFRLPSEAEWEYAVRAGSTTRWSFGDEESQLGDYGWFCGNSGLKTHPVGEKKPNGFGLYDMYGNVWECCEDSWEDNYNTPRAQKAYKNQNNDRLLRGGSYYDYTYHCCSAYRSHYLVQGGSDYGLRFVSDYSS
ncbi:MAG: hypothetical protein RL368_502 [Pseudomonadota bacterium]|jgi:formylglycine-generating enzyme required for sulfatase activity